MWIIADSLSYVVPDESLIETQRSNLSIIELKQLLLDNSLDINQLALRLYTINPETIVKCYDSTSDSWQVVPYVYNLSISCKNCSYSVEGTLTANSSITVTFKSIGNHALPSTLRVIGATLVSYDSTTGVAVISNPTDDVTILCHATTVISLAGENTICSNKLICNG